MFTINLAFWEALLSLMLPPQLHQLQQFMKFVY